MVLPIRDDPLSGLVKKKKHYHKVFFSAMEIRFFKIVHEAVVRNRFKIKNRFSG